MQYFLLIFPSGFVTSEKQRKVQTVDHRNELLVWIRVLIILDFFLFHQESDPFSSFIWQQLCIIFFLTIQF